MRARAAVGLGRMVRQTLGFGVVPSWAAAAVLALVVALALAPAPRAAARNGAAGGLELVGQAGEGPAADGADRLLDGWSGFQDVWMLADIALVLLVALVLGAVIAYHPTVRKKMATLEDFEQPKAMLMYSVIGAVCAVIVKNYPAMGIVIFAIGGLMRFRTDVGPAKDTGRVILVTIVGVCCGLKLVVVAVLASLTGWMLIYYLDRKGAGRLQVKGLERDAIPRAAEAYSAILLEAGCRVMGEKKNFAKGQVSFVFTAPADLAREALEDAFAELPEDSRGSVDWEFS